MHMIPGSTFQWKTRRLHLKIIFTHWLAQRADRSLHHMVQRQSPQYQETQMSLWFMAALSVLTRLFHIVSTSKVAFFLFKQSYCDKASIQVKCHFSVSDQM